jgi:hypothetical protein
MDHFGLPVSPLYTTYRFDGNCQSAGASWYTWNRPLGKSRIMMFLLGGGGGGGTGVVGANSTAAGGGGGGSGGQTIVEMPLDFLPPRLYISVGQAKTGAGIASYVSTQPNTTANHVVALANGGAVGGNASGATGGAAGGAGGIATNATMPLGWAFSKLALAGQAGIIGGAAVAGGALTQPLTGLRVTGGTGGGGLPAAAATGTAGGAITAIASPSYFQGNPGGGTQATATSPANPGSHGFALPEAGRYFVGGTGGGSTHGTATGGGLVQAPGGNGAIGCGGGGMGGALTGSAAAAASLGGPGLVIFYCY